MKGESLDCEMCGAPATVTWERHDVAAGPGPRGAESIVTLRRIDCAAGHWYNETLQGPTLHD